MAKFRRELRTVAERSFGYLSALIKTGEGFNQITTSFSLPLPVCPELPLPLSHFSLAAAVP